MSIVHVILYDWRVPQRYQVYLFRTRHVDPPLPWRAERRQNGDAHKCQDHIALRRVDRVAKMLYYSLFLYFFIVFLSIISKSSVLCVAIFLHQSLKAIPRYVSCDYTSVYTGYPTRQYTALVPLGPSLPPHVEIPSLARHSSARCVKRITQTTIWELWQ